MKSYTMIIAAAMVAICATAPAMAQSESFPSSYIAADHNMRSSKLIGMAVYNEQGEKIGTFDDIMLPMAGGEVTAVISVGGLFSNGEKLVKIPLSHVRFTGNKPMMTGDGSKVAIMAMPFYKYNYSGGNG